MFIIRDLFMDPPADCRCSTNFNVKYLYVFFELLKQLCTLFQFLDNFYSKIMNLLLSHPRLSFNWVLKSKKNLF